MAFAHIAQVGARVELARDHLGLEPLYYSLNGADRPRVSKSIESIWDHGSGSYSSLNDSAAVAHIAGPFSPPAGTTFYQQIRSVKPGTVISIENGQVEERAFWAAEGVSVDNSTSLAEAATELRELMYAVMLDYLPGGPVAATLSSGMDSATVLAALTQSDPDVLAVTWNAPEFPAANEALWARQTADKLGVRLVEVPISAETLLPEEGIVTRQGDPFFNVFSGVWSRMAEAAAAEGRHTLFTGLSGDHILGGNLTPAADLLLSLRFPRLIRYLRSSRPRHQSIRGLLRSDLAGPLARQIIPGVWARRQQPVPWLHSSQRETWRELQRERVGPGIRPGRAERISGLSDGLLSTISDESNFHTEAFGVQLAHPLLDRRIIEFALSLPVWLLDDGMTEKLVLREAMKGVLPDEVISLARITPESVAQAAIRARAQQLMPLTRGMRAADLRLVDEPVFAEHVAAFMSGEHNEMRFWQTLTLEDWLRRWF